MGQRLRRRDMQTASQRGIYAVRRQISPISHSIFEAISERLEPEVENAARLFDVDSLGITIIGFSRFHKAHINKGLPTAEVIDMIPSASEGLTAKIGKLGVYGSGRKQKLGFRLESKNLTAEVRAFEQTFHDTGSWLKQDYYNPGGEVVTHCSVALLFEDSVEYFKHRGTLQRIGNAALGQFSGSMVSLKPIAPHSKS